MEVYAEGTQQENVLPAIFRDGRILQGIAQLIFVMIVVVVMNDLGTRINSALDATNQSPNFEFLQNRAGFGIADSGSYESSDRYIDAFRIGFINTLRVVLLGLIATTVIGILVGISLLSRNFLVRTLSRSYVEVLRNTPVLLQIFCLVLHCHFRLAAAAGVLRLSARRHSQLAAAAIRALTYRYSVHLAVQRQPAPTRLAHRRPTNWHRHRRAGESVWRRTNWLGNAYRVYPGHLCQHQGRRHF